MQGDVDGLTKELNDLASSPLIQSSGDDDIESLSIAFEL